MSAPVIHIRDLATRFGETWIHRNLNLEIAAGEMVALVGGPAAVKQPCCAR